MRTLTEWSYNFRWIVPKQVARSAQVPSGILERSLKKNGIKSVINLRGQHPETVWWRRETSVCANSGVTHLDVEMDTRQFPTCEIMASLINAFDAAPLPLMIKCADGRNRTGLAAAFYLIHRHGWGAQRVATEQFTRFPFLNSSRHQKLWLQDALHFIDARP